MPNIFRRKWATADETSALHAEEVSEPDTGVGAVTDVEVDTDLDVDTDVDVDTAAPPEDVTKRARTWSGTRLITLVAAVAVVSLLIGIGIMQFIVSPADIAARTAAPEPGPVTSQIENRVIENTVVSRGEVTYADAVDVTVEAATTGNRPVVTGSVPEVGTVLNAGNIALEVAGRPLIVLAGDLPAYRSMSIGMRGPDVLQLKRSLSGMGYWAGDTESDTFEYDTATALGVLYEQIGYSPASGGDEAQDALRSAERNVRDSQVSLAQAQATLQQAVDAAAPTLIGEQAAVNSAYQSVNDAQEALGTAQAAVLPTLPAGEALFLAGLPRRVDNVTVSRGDVLSGSPMSVSGATLTIVGSASKQDAELLTEGAAAFFAGPGGEDLSATVQKITAPKTGGTSTPNKEENPGGGGGDSSASKDAGSRYTINFAPGELTPEQVDALRGTNVRVKIPVASTEGEVLAVPLAALSSGSGGENRVELLIDVRDGANAETENIAVEVGLAADGFVEISSDDPRIKPGASVVVGR